MCKSVTFLPKFCTIPNIQPWHYTTQIAEELHVKIIKSNKGKTPEQSKRLQALEQLSKSSQVTGLVAELSVRVKQVNQLCYIVTVAVINLC